MSIYRVSACVLFFLLKTQSALSEGCFIYDFYNTQSCRQMWEDINLAGVDHRCPNCNSQQAGPEDPETGAYPIEWYCADKDVLDFYENGADEQRVKNIIPSASGRWFDDEYLFHPCMGLYRCGGDCYVSPVVHPPALFCPRYMVNELFLIRPIIQSNCQEPPQA